MRPVVRGLIDAANRPAPTPSRRESPLCGLVHSPHAETAAGPKVADRMKGMDELHKMMGLAGKSKNPEAAKAAVRKRAKELGVGLPKGY